MLHLCVPEDAGSPGRDWGIGDWNEGGRLFYACLPTKKIVIKSVLAFGQFSAEMYKGFFFFFFF